MAAILCESISKILKGSCEAVGTCLTLPCKACGCATGQLTELCRSPFCLYLTVAVGLNLPPIIFTGKAWGGGGGYGDEGCQSASNWMNLNAILCLINIAAALYISAKITYVTEEETNASAAPYVEATTAPTNEKSTLQPKTTLMKKVMEQTLTDTRSRSLSRVKEILCYDPVVALYIVIGIFFMIWQSMGVARSRLAMECGGGLDEYLSHSLMCGFLFIFVGGMAFSISLCCMGR
mmetsp:Transcript_20487/g.35220  ORF Transcript_20487/g.35220 Transcript_20487/m.35220 type:complete len:235 (-) Transcript_20487:170-874(-)|eukprot:CAMPEP_0183720948 /NCGR_PEP_ID=MMETSP0737-20130205/13424_1 /TAXON_ID=385413 /ORGANISM="Thalassiosira miniscula, Strain CCMP1093" /LENGTH=234 /DNA_ID=CAMNT_0025950905 /DNA_START=47 /DNA_END=751 /DNA_ORIENTATION=+